MTAWTDKDWIALTIDQFDMLGILPHTLPNAIGMWPNEQECLVWCTLEAPLNLDWVEVGSFCGGSAAILSLAKRSGGGSVVAIDVAHKPIFDLNMKRLEFDNVKKVQSTGVAYLQSNTNPIGLLFLDGFHSFRSVVAEFEAAQSQLTDDAIICFHDVSPAMWTNSNQTHMRNCYRYALDNWQDLMSSEEEDFRIDEAIAYICEMHKYKIIEIPIREPLQYYRETGLDCWVRGRTSPHNAFTAIRKIK